MEARKIETWALTIDIFKTGFFLAVAFLVVYLIIWGLIRNLKWLFGGKGKSSELVNWLVTGLKKGYDDEDLKTILLGRDYNLERINGALREAYKIMIREVEGKNAKERRGLGSPEEEIKKLKDQE